ncbi:hypothetical protein SPONN_1399 [uncultured Candidatus Thioglobus sp.]|nr:hypothetical protein SPONN_1399 [uncultured Candidatus Thioglobus sp.]
MIKSSTPKYTFGRHSSFQLRYGWLTKGFLALKEDENIFTSDNATATLGVGKNMVGSIAYWLKAARIVDEKNKITSFGESLLGKYDTYLEDDASLWLLHLTFAQNKTIASSIYWLFNHFHKSSFTSDEAFNALKDFLSNNKTKISSNTLKMDISVILRMYAPHKSNKNQIEDMLESPLSLLNLITYHNGKYHFNQSKNEQIPTEIIGFAISEYMADNEIIVLKDLMYGDQLSLGKIFKISEDNLVFYLEKLVDKYPQTYQLREDAGIFQLHILKQIDSLKFLEKYYEQS